MDTGRLFTARRAGQRTARAEQVGPDMGVVIEAVGGGQHRRRIGTQVAERHLEITGILDIDDQLGASAGRDLADGAELLAAVGNKCLKANLNFFLHELSLHGPSGAML